MDDIAAIRVALLGMDKRSSSLLTVYIHMMSKGRCKVCGIEDADITVIDFDAPDALQTLANAKATRPDAAIIGLAYGNAVPPELAHLEKPVGGPELLAALYSVSAAAPMPGTAATPHRSSVTKALRAAANASPATPARTVPAVTPSPPAIAQPPHVMASAPAAASVDPPSAVTRAAKVVDISGAQAAMADRYADKFHVRGVLVSADPNETFDPNAGPIKFVRAMITKARRNSQSYEVLFRTLPDVSIQFHADFKGLVSTAMSDGTLRSLCVSANTLGSDEVRVRECAPYDPALTHVRTTNNKELLWKLALWCGRGRRPNDISDDTPVSLRRWPNLTRALATDHAVPICALLAAAPHSMAETARLLDIDIRFVHAICGAAEAIRVLVIHANPAVASTPPIAPAPNPPTGLFGRIIKHIFG